MLSKISSELITLAPTKCVRGTRNTSYLLILSPCFKLILSMDLLQRLLSWQLGPASRCWIHMAANLALLEVTPDNSAGHQMLSRTRRAFVEWSLLPPRTLPFITIAGTCLSQASPLINRSIMDQADRPEASDVFSDVSRSHRGLTRRFRWKRKPRENPACVKDQLSSLKARSCRFRSIPVPARDAEFAFEKSPAIRSFWGRDEVLSGRDQGAT
jgi:hypothetical protein